MDIIRSDIAAKVKFEVKPLICTDFRRLKQTGAGQAIYYPYQQQKSVADEFDIEFKVGGRVLEFSPQDSK